MQTTIHHVHAFWRLRGIINICTECHNAHWVASIPRVRRQSENIYVCIQFVVSVCMCLVISHFLSFTALSTASASPDSLNNEFEPIISVCEHAWYMLAYARLYVLHLLGCHGHVINRQVNIADDEERRRTRRVGKKKKTSTLKCTLRCWANNKVSLTHWNWSVFVFSSVACVHIYMHIKAYTDIYTCVYFVYVCVCVCACDTRVEWWSDKDNVTAIMIVCTAGGFFYLARVCLNAASRYYMCVHVSFSLSLSLCFNKEKYGHAHALAHLPIRIQYAL